MTKINRLQNPIFSHYGDESIKEALKIDFLKKCYICEESTRHFEVDHFYPQKPYEHLINKYENLFYICQKCNKVKPKIINTHSDNEILNCCETDPAEYIKLKLNTKECRIEIEQIKNEPNLNIQIQETIKLLNRIYNGVNSNSSSCEDLKDDVKQKIEDFRKKLDKYEKTKLKAVALNEIIEEVSAVSSYVTFKRWIVRDSAELNKEFGQYL
jgi:hypothetical protein